MEDMLKDSLKLIPREAALKICQLATEGDDLFVQLDKVNLYQSKGGEWFVDIPLTLDTQELTHAMHADFFIRIYSDGNIRYMTNGSTVTFNLRNPLGVYKELLKVFGENYG